MLTGATKQRSERFSFALVVAITPFAIGREALRLLHATRAAAATGSPVDLHGTLVFSLLGAVFSFLAGLVALKWLSNWLENGRWYLFGIYCLIASAVVFYLHTKGY
jgi:undecaprenyl-diphosphatase